MRLSQLYPTLSTEEREALAKRAGIKHVGYLHQIATRWRNKKPSIKVIAQLAAADKRLKVSDMVAEFSTKQEA